MYYIFTKVLYSIYSIKDWFFYIKMVVWTNILRLYKHFKVNHIKLLSYTFIKQTFYINLLINWFWKVSEDNVFLSLTTKSDKNVKKQHTLFHKYSRADIWINVKLGSDHGPFENTRWNKTKDISLPDILAETLQKKPFHQIYVAEYIS